MYLRVVCILHAPCTQRDDSKQVFCCWPIIYILILNLENLALCSVSRIEIYKQSIY
jgi:hypothetical protein